MVQPSLGLIPHHCIGYWGLYFTGRGAGDQSMFTWPHSSRWNPPVEKGCHGWTIRNLGVGGMTQAWDPHCHLGYARQSSVKRDYRNCEGCFRKGGKKVIQCTIINIKELLFTSKINVIYSQSIIIHIILLFINIQSIIIYFWCTNKYYYSYPKFY